MILSVLIAASVGTVKIPEPKYFGDWVVGCDNRRDCEAVGFPPGTHDEEKPLVIGVTIVRKAEGLAEPKAYIDLRFSEIEDFSGSLIADGRKTDLSFDDDGDLVGDPRRFAEVLAKSRSLSLINLQGKTLGTFPTEGASAALRWMDDRQRRANTVTALVARGEGPASAVPAPPDLPTIVAPATSNEQPRRLTEAQVAEVRKQFDLCDEPRREPEYYRLDSANSLAIVNCWIGPYQSDGVIVILPEAGGYRFAQIDRPTPPDPDMPAVDLHRLISPGYDPERRLLWEEYRGRGLNDCGSNASWAWDGFVFRLASYSALDVCRGVTSRISLWQTANDPLTEE